MLTFQLSLEIPQKLCFFGLQAGTHHMCPGSSILQLQLAPAFVHNCSSRQQSPASCYSPLRFLKFCFLPGKGLRDLQDREVCNSVEELSKITLASLVHEMAILLV